MRGNLNVPVEGRKSVDHHVGLHQLGCISWVASVGLHQLGCISWVALMEQVRSPGGISLLCFDVVDRSCCELKLRWSELKRVLNPIPSLGALLLNRCLSVLWYGRRINGLNHLSVRTIPYS